MAEIIAWILGIYVVWLIVAVLFFVSNMGNKHHRPSSVEQVIEFIILWPILILLLPAAWIIDKVKRNG